MDLGSPARSRSSPARAAASAAASRSGSPEEGADVVLCARGARRSRRGGAPRSRARAGRPASSRTSPTPDGAAAVVDGRGRAVRRPRHRRQQRRRLRRQRPSTTWTAPISQAVLDRNLFPALNVSRAALPALRARGGGVIAMIASIWGREAGGGPSYNIAKAAEISLAKAMARDLAKDGVRVFSVAPGSTLFPGGSWERRMRDDPEGMAAFIERELPWGRLGTRRRDRRRRHVPRLAARIVGRRDVRHDRRRPVAIVLSASVPREALRSGAATTLAVDGDCRPCRSVRSRSASALRRSVALAARRALVRDARPRRSPRSRAASARRSSATATASSTRSRSGG